MSSDLTPPPAARPRPPAVGEPLVEFVRTQRANAAYALFGLAAAFLVAGVLLANKGEKLAGTAAPPAITLDPEAPPPPPAELDTPKKSDYRFGWIACAAGFLITGGAGVRLIASLPKKTEAAQRASARRFVLSVGTGLGATLILVGAVYFYRWSDSLTKWLDAGDKKEMQWVVIPLLMVVAGAGVVFAAVQPARSEERNDQTTRRMVYGANLGLTVLLLLVALVIGNVVAALKVQNTLDTTSTGFYTLSNATKTTVGRLTEPVTAYVVLQDDGSRVINDIRQLMYTTQEASGGKLTPKFISPVTNKVELQQLEQKYKKLSSTGFGILLVTGPDATARTEFVPESDLVKSDPRPGGGQQMLFVGEAALVQKLRFLTEPEKAVVYVTQGNGELSLDAGGGDDGRGKADRQMSQLKAHLEAVNLEVKPLRLRTGFDGGAKADVKTEVPADAAVVLVADPTETFKDDAVKTLRDYMTGPRKGRLVLLAAPRPSADAKDTKVVKTGLEGLTAELGVKLGEQYVYSQPMPQFRLPAKTPTVVFASGPAGEHPIAQPFPQYQFSWGIPRELTPVPGGAFQVAPLLATRPERATWLEDEELADPNQAFEDLLNNPALIRAKGAANKARYVGVAVSESGGPPPNPMNPHAPAGGDQKPRMVVYANGSMFSNATQQIRGGGTPLAYELMSSSIDWLRERPPLAAGIDPKLYTIYTFPAAETVNETRLIWLPLGFAMFGVAGLGAGVWVIRRK